MLGRWWALAGACTLLFLLGGCASGGNDVRLREQSPAEHGAAPELPGLPREPYLSSDQIAARQADVLTSGLRIGRDTWDRGGNTFEVTGRSLEIGGTPALSWAMYRFEGFAHWETVAGVGVSIIPLGPPGTPNVLWVAYADFAADRWVMQRLVLQENGDGFEGVGQLVSVAPTHEPISPFGNVYVAVLTMDTTVRLDSVDLVYDEPLPPPVGLSATTGTLDGQVELRWTDPAVTYDPDGPAAPGAFAYDGIWIERALAASPDASWERLENLGPGVTSFMDGDDFSPLDPATTYFYRLRTVHLFGSEFAGGRPSEAVSGRAGAQPVASFTADPPFGTSVTLVTFDASGSYDPDGEIVEYRWRIGTPYVNAITYTPLLQMEVDLAAEPEAYLTVVGNDGFMSQEYGAPLASGLEILDDPSQPDPGQPGTVSGGPGNWQLDLGFIVQGGTPSYRMELDSNYTGTFAPDPGLPIVMLKDFADDPNTEGPYWLSANLPAGQSSGSYTMALRVTDSSIPPDVAIVVWPNPVSLFP